MLEKFIRKAQYSNDPDKVNSVKYTIKKIGYALVCLGCLLIFTSLMVFIFAINQITKTVGNNINDTHFMLNIVLPLILIFVGVVLIILGRVVVLKARRYNTIILDNPASNVKLHCSKCNWIVSIDDKKCPHCNATIIKKVKCKYCNHFNNIVETDGFCEHCGRILEQEINE